MIQAGEQVNMKTEELLQAIKDMTPEQKKAFGLILNGEEEEKPKITNREVLAENPRAKTVYFFEDKRGRVIAESQRAASKLYWTKTGYKYLGWSTGEVWKTAREAGRSIKEAQDAEYKFMLEYGHKDPPPDTRNTNHGKGIFAATRSLQQISDSGKDLEYQSNLQKIKDAYKENMDQSSE